MKPSRANNSAQQSRGGRSFAAKNDSKTGLPNQLKSGIENLSGYSMNDVKVNYNSSKPAQMKAHAYAQGTNIHVAPGQEKHLPHEAWHVVQQKQGRVKATTQLKGIGAINTDMGLEREADVMGAKAMNINNGSSATQLKSSNSSVTAPIQCFFNPAIINNYRRARDLWSLAYGRITHFDEELNQRYPGGTGGNATLDALHRNTEMKSNKAKTTSAGESYETWHWSVTGQAPPLAAAAPAPAAAAVREPVTIDGPGGADGVDVVKYRPETNEIENAGVNTKEVKSAESRQSFKDGIVDGIIKHAGVVEMHYNGANADVTGFLNTPFVNGGVQYYFSEVPFAGALSVNVLFADASRRTYYVGTPPPAPAAAAGPVKMQVDD